VQRGGASVKDEALEALVVSLLHDEQVAQLGQVEFDLVLGQIVELIAEVVLDARVWIL
jgi:hypothetical protein